MLIDAPSMPPTLLPVEEQRVPLKKRHWWQRKHSDADVLRRAIGVIDERGWTSGSWEGYQGKVCILGAIGIASLEAQGRELPDKRPGHTSRVAPIMVAADKLVGSSKRGPLWRWNDVLSWQQGDRVGAVKKQLAKMAAEADANGGSYPR